MIGIYVIASGSTGNCYRVTDGTNVLMIECGLPVAKIKKAFDFKMSSVAGCLISHEHGDHSKAVKDVMKAGISCFMSEGTKTKLNVSGHRIKPVKPKELFSVGTFKIMPFDTQHDCEQPFGFLIQSGEDKLLFATDTYYLKYKFKGLTHIMIECNYSKKLLDENIENGSVPEVIRNRIVKSHFEIENLKEFFLSNDMAKVKEIHLIHLSSTNADPELFKSEIQKITGKPVYV